MNQQHLTQAARALDVSIDIRREEGGFLSALVYRPDGTLIVIGPPTDTQANAIAIARGMWRHSTLAIPDSLNVWGTA